jgi:transglutaminase-like putative cysteine protease
VELVGASNEDGNAVFVSGTLVNLVDRGYRVDRRRTPSTKELDSPTEWAGQSDSGLFGALVNDQTYRAISLMPNVSAEELRQAGQDYPDWLTARYLALPDGTPSRVLALGRELTATQPTPYDRAKAIETYLRSIPYTLDLTAPPTNRDVVDYFLFTLKRGYCDYYATAMVVLARAAGLPARLVMGYATGAYDAPNARYIVTEANAHSWPEIYFPDYGWIEFEPTAGQPALERPEAVTSASQPSISPGESTSALATATSRPGWPWQAWFSWAGAGLVGAALVLSLVFIADTWRLRFLPPAAVLARIFRGIYRRGHSLNLSLNPGDTPFEVTDSLGLKARELSNTAQWSRLLQPMPQELHDLAILYAKSLYSQAPAGRLEKRQAIQIWGRLRWRLWLAQLLGSRLTR